MMTKILHIDSSGRLERSVSRKLSAQIVNQIKGDAQVSYRDISKNMEFVNDTMVAAYFTPDDKRTNEQKQSLLLSDSITKDLFEHDIYVFGIPMYNFSMPAAFKAWCDLAARAHVTFKYTSEGPIGLLSGKKAYIAIASGGTVLGSKADFLTHWLRYFLNFIGIEDIDMISAADLSHNSEEKIAKAKAYISTLKRV